jgi:hypothetical protein
VRDARHVNKQHIQRHQCVRVALTDFTTLERTPHNVDEEATIIRNPELADTNKICALHSACAQGASATQWSEDQIGTQAKSAAQHGATRLREGYSQAVGEIDCACDEANHTDTFNYSRKGK